MRTIAIVGGLLGMILLFPPESPGKIAQMRTRIAAVQAPGSDQGGKFGALTLAWGNEGAKPELRIVFLTESTRMTKVADPRLGDRVPIRLKDLKAGMTVVATMWANRAGDDTSWKLSSLHVPDPAESPSPAPAKHLDSSPDGGAGSVTEVRRWGN